MSTHRITRTEADMTTNGSLMWRCQTDTGERVNLFKHSDPFKDQRGFEAFDKAGYMRDMFPLKKGQVLHWKNYPIPVTMVKEPDRNGREWWTITAVEPRPDGAIPDPEVTPDLHLMKEYACLWAREIANQDLVVYLDSETTGTGESDELISLAIIDRYGKNLFSSLLKPTDISRMAQPVWGDGLTPMAKTGITPEMLVMAPTFTEAYGEIVRRLIGKIWMIYNSDFDVRLLKQTCLRYGLSPIPSLGVSCAMKMFAAWFGEWNPQYQEFTSKKLEFACETLGIPLRQSHNALEDALMLREVVMKMGA